jgi:lipoprotein NlpI
LSRLDRPEAFNLLGVLMQLQNQYQDAQRYYQSALALQPGYKPAVYNRDNIARSPTVRNPSDYRLE